ncbi:HpcH/HpaI aldolase/citrate lyase family protein [Candidatus Neomarinimicrobiota bacterium]
MSLKDKNVMIGSWINTASPIVAELMSAANFDFLVVDAEHSSVSIAQAQSLFLAIKAGNSNCTAIVRVPGNNYAETKRYLDAGAMGVIVPLINSREEAMEVIRSVKYPPMGERGVGFGRSHGYGFDFERYMASANDEIFICIQIEHELAVKNIDDILSTPGIDAVMIGPYDLSASMGITAEFEHPRYIEALKKILAKCEEYNIIPGIHVVQPNHDEALEKINQGYKMIGYSMDITMLGEMSRKGLQMIRKGVSHIA